MSWAVTSRGIFHDIHVVPVNDVVEHVESVLCWCRPRVEHMAMTRMVTHNSADGREYFEEDGPSSPDHETIS